VIGDEIDILTDANTAYTMDDARRVLPVLADIQAGWLEEPFACNDFHSYREAAKSHRSYRLLRAKITMVAMSLRNC